MTDQQIINVMGRLLADCYISRQELELLDVRDGKIYDDTRSIVEVCENGDVYIHGGAYPTILRGYANA